jgi:hypothetical protein
MQYISTGTWNTKHIKFTLTYQKVEAIISINLKKSKIVLFETAFQSYLKTIF